MVQPAADLAAEQWGLVTTAQVRSLGVSPQTVARLAAEGGLDRVTHGVYRVSGVPPSPLDEVRAAWLALDPARRVADRLRDESPVVVSHRSAAAILGLGDLEADRSEFTSLGRKQTRRPGIQIHRGHVGPTEWTVVDGLPVTTVVRTVADLAAARVDGGHLASVVRDALTRQQVDEQLLADALRRHAHHYGVGVGDGKALLARFLQESGVSEPLERAVVLASPTGSDELARRSREQAVQLKELKEQLADIQRSLAPVARISEQIANLPAMKVIAEAAQQLEILKGSPAVKSTSTALQTVAEQQAVLVNSPAMKAVAELARQLQSPEMQRLARHHQELARLTRPMTKLNKTGDRSAGAQAATAPDKSDDG